MNSTHFWEKSQVFCRSLWSGKWMSPMHEISVERGGEFKYRIISAIWARYMSKHHQIVLCNEPHFSWGSTHKSQKGHFLSGLLETLLVPTSTGSWVKIAPGVQIRPFWVNLSTFKRDTAILSLVNFSLKSCFSLSRPNAINSSPTEIWSRCRMALAVRKPQSFDLNRRH